MPTRATLASAPRLAALVLGLALALGGCSNTTRVFAERATATTGTATATDTAGPRPSTESAYLAQLGAEQQQLAGAEARIPTTPRTPAELARSIDLLDAAVRRLVDGLAGITPPASVAVPHARLVAIMRTYAAQLGRAARIATTRGGGPAAGRLLLMATRTAGHAFTATLAQIDSTLGSAGA